MFSRFYRTAACRVNTISLRSPHVSPIPCGSLYYFLHGSIFIRDCRCRRNYLGVAVRRDRTSRWLVSSRTFAYGRFVDDVVRRGSGGCATVTCYVGSYGRILTCCHFTFSSMPLHGLTRSRWRHGAVSHRHRHYPCRCCVCLFAWLPSLCARCALLTATLRHLLLPTSTVRGMVTAFICHTVSGAARRAVGPVFQPTFACYVLATRRFAVPVRTFRRRCCAGGLRTCHHAFCNICPASCNGSALFWRSPCSRLYL